MEAKLMKHYHDEEMDAQILAQTYGGAHVDTREELQDYPMAIIYELLSTGAVKGDLLIDVSGGPNTGLLLVLSNYCKNIIVLESSAASQAEMQKWINGDPGALDWSHTVDFLLELMGGSDSSEELQEKTRRAIKHCLLWNPTNDNSLVPLELAPADTLISTWYLEIACKTHDDYRKCLKSFHSLLKVGGRIILFVLTKLTHYMVGQHRFSTLSLDEEFVGKTLMDSSFVIERSSMKSSKVNTHLVKYENIGYFVARKETCA